MFMFTCNVFSLFNDSKKKSPISFPEYVASFPVGRCRSVDVNKAETQ